MLQLRENYKDFVSFKNTEDKDIIPYSIFLTAVFTIISVANFSPYKIQKIISPLITFVLLSVPENLLQISVSKDYSPFPKDFIEKISEEYIVNNIVIPLRGFIFYIAFLVVIYPIVKCLWESKSFWYELGIKRIALLALSLFLVLSLFTFPYSYPYGLNSSLFGLSGLGIPYGRMSLDPFAVNWESLYRRLLKPAIAHFIQMDGEVLYYLFSLICTYILIFLTVAFLESKILDEDKSKILAPKVKFLLYLSVMTSSYLMVSFQWPGYPEHLSFILILIMACIPMNSQTRLATVALCMVNHDGSAFALVPIIFFCFPLGEKTKAFLIISLYYSIWLASYGFNVLSGFEAHGVVGKEYSNLDFLASNPGLAIAGVFFAYKLLWIVFLYLAWILWCQKDKATLAAIISIVLFPVLMILLAWDTTRLVGFGFLGMLITLGILIQNYHLYQQKYQLLMGWSIMYANILLPSYNINLQFKDSLSSYSYPGIYMLIDWIFTNIH